MLDVLPERLRVMVTNGLFPPSVLVCNQFGSEIARHLRGGSRLDSLFNKFDLLPLNKVEVSRGFREGGANRMNKSRFDTRSDFRVELVKIGLTTLRRGGEGGIPPSKDRGKKDL